MRSNQDSAFAFLFIVLAVVSASLVLFAPDRPERWFIGLCLSLVVITLLTVFGSKATQPAPINWMTSDVLFAGSFSVVHFAYFFYWIFGLLNDQTELWYLRNANVPEEVCRCLAMYATCVNLFLAGYNLIATRRIRPIINELQPPRELVVAWGNLGRMLIRGGFLCFLAFVLIIGPSRFFGIYSGTNNISFVANIFFQIGQVFLIAGITTAMASRQRMLINRNRQPRFGIGYFNMFLFLATLVAIGLHGDRSTLLFIFLPFLIGYSEYIRPIRLKTLAVSGLIVVSLLGFIVVFRSGQQDRYVFDPIANINGALVNLGTSSVCGFVAADYVPDHHGYYYGQMQVLHLAGIIPFGRKLVGMKDSVDNSSSMLLTELIQGRVGQGVAGTGTSVFADFYFDFGFLGTALIFLIVGAFNKYIQNRARESTSLLWQVAFVTNVTFIALCSRYTLCGGLIRFVLYSAIYTWFLGTVTGTPLGFAKQYQNQEKKHSPRMPQTTRSRPG